ncbi:MULTISPECIES: HNH endonuclease signature motif containing protein [unclassified Mesorhizobium]|uniref:HNH endonuclease n=1 Tax=unclassified Mesorhizobium TaxID=325217 RepID=UPI000FE7D9C2|nr:MULTISPECIES: HNH endonuclease signature motif containing protein [unclassified Mesorhizobium]RWH25247.1 MAG: HNH endonuclease [Mesorhizobium sp.]RWH35571.1 MAG: HNH endonuclease [Mesorhizobium sp.]TGS85771.1 HNH endonuclease [Mesorhizobium sp. M3A.F.Ca.ET.175.01.1.1]TGT23919.1 HNH endonuclease [Mesorhizobium sp. M3A.F.Ca.ET.174.01.1.1]TIR57946.1 MAG: HNH endonuclease [Mesorhizobium sp.]
MKAYARDGRILDAEFDLEETGGGIDIVLHSNGGVSRGKPAYNPDYIEALETILGRLAALDASLDGIWVDSRALSNLNQDERQVRLEASTYPVRLSEITDIKQLRLQIRRSVSQIGMAAGQTPGTGNKRVRLAISFESPLSHSAVEIELRGGLLTEEILVGLLATQGENGDELPQLTNAPDLRIPNVRREVWNLVRDATPIIKHRISRYVERGPIGDTVKAANGYRCQICDVLGQRWDAFIKPDGSPYVEAHHVVLVSTLRGDVLGPQNIITVCPNHHRQLHFGGVVTRDLQNEFEFAFPNGVTCRIRKFIAEAS